MQDMDNVRTALGQWLGRWHASLMPASPVINEFAKRQLSKAIAFAPSRMIDAAEEMLNQWLRNDTDSAPTTPARMPVVLVAVAQDTPATGRDWGHNLSDNDYVMLDGDPKQRVFKLRTQMVDVRVQALICAHEPDAARHLAATLALYCEGYNTKRTHAIWPFAGIQTKWPMLLESDDVMASRIASEAKNLTMMALDFTFKVTQPFYLAPKSHEPNDGRGKFLEDGYPDPQDPCGWPVVADVSVVHSVVEPSGAINPINDWSQTWQQQ